MTADQIYQLHIRATAEAIWTAITTPDFTERYFHRARISIDAEHYSSFGPNGEVWGDAKVLEFDPPRRLVHEWRSLYDADLATEPASRVTWEIEPDELGCWLTVTHDHLAGSPGTAEKVAGRGWMSVLSGLKSVLETRS